MANTELLYHFHFYLSSFPHLLAQNNLFSLFPTSSTMSQDNVRSSCRGLLLLSLLCVNLNLMAFPKYVQAISSGTAATTLEVNLATSSTLNVSTTNSVTTDAPPTAISQQTSGSDSAETSTNEPSTTTPTTPVHEIIGSAGPDKKEQDAIQKALDWLKLKRASDYGWGNDTHVVILAKELSGARDPTDADGHLQVILELEDMLSVKEMEVEILAMLDRHHTLPKPLNLERLARYVLALGSLCKDPKHFHGHDLVATLQHHEPTQDIEFALTTLSACSSAAHVRKRQIRRLLDIASGVADQSVDTIAMV